MSRNGLEVGNKEYYQETADKSRGNHKEKDRKERMIVDLIKRFI